MKAPLQLARLAVVAAALAFVLVGCGGGGGDDGPADTVGEPDTVSTDVAPPADVPPVDTAADMVAVDVPVAPTVALLRAFSADGTTVLASFSAPLDEATVVPASFRVLNAADDAAGPSVTAAALEDGIVRLTLDAALPMGAVSDLLAVDVLSADGLALDPARARTTILGRLHLALVWHQHQPVYIESDGDYLRGPWVRKHATKDYYDMAALLADHPDIHVQINLTPVLLMQLQTYYLDRLAPFVDVEASTVDVDGYFTQPAAEDGSPVTDPWVDMLLRPTPDPATLTEQQRGWFWEDIWSTFSISEVMIARFPAYRALLDKRDSAPETFTQDDLLNMKVWFELAWFDPIFLRGPVTLPDGSVVDLSDLVTEGEDDTFTADAPFTEEIAQRLVVEDYKVMANVVAIHRALMYDPDTKEGQIEVMTTPFYHPILPLLTDTELAHIAMPSAALPSPAFTYPEDARVHVAKAVARHEQLFGRPVTGMWPAEGSVAEAVVPIFHEYGVRWIATDRRVLERSTPANQPIYSPYRVDVDGIVGDGGDDSDELAIVFRDTEISDKIGFHYQGGTPEENVEYLIASLENHLGPYGLDRLFTIILDGENAWEWYRLDNDARGFLNGMYNALTEAQEAGTLRTTTVSEYLDGNPARGIAPHPVHELPELEPLHAGSWIGGDYGIWIGEDEENLAWTYLAQVRADLEEFAAQGLTRPAPTTPEPTPDTPEWYAWKAWETMYAAEGSDWFWWYGADQTAVGGDEPFDRIFRTLLRSIYEYAQAAGIDTEIPDFPPVLRVCNPPPGPLAAEPTIDGAFDPDDGADVTRPNEWTEAGAGVCMDPDSGATLNPDDVIGIWYHGVTDDALYLALRTNVDLSTKLGTDFQLRLYVSHKHIASLDPEEIQQDPALATTRTGDPITFNAGGAARELTIDFQEAAPVAQLATAGDASWGAGTATAAVGIGFDAAVGTVLELRIPLSALNWQADDPLELLIVATEAGEELDRVPALNGVVVFQDRSLLVEVTIVLDATGERLPLDAVKAIDNPPPPAGTGTAFIVGNLPELASWTPNTVPMADDGETHGDETAGDNLWTFRLSVPPLSELQYKFTIGSEGEGWGPTEEFPLTNRGLLVSDANGDLLMKVVDVFADRPDPSGSMGDLTEIANP